MAGTRNPTYKPRMVELKAIDWASVRDWKGELAEWVSSGDRGESYLRSRLAYLWALGEKYGVPYSQLGRIQVAAWMNGVRDNGLNGDRSEPLAPSSQQAAFAAVKCILSYFDNAAAFKGLKYGYIESRTGDNGEGTLTDSESWDMAERIGKRPWKTAWVLIRASAMRPGECMKLKTEDVEVITHKGKPALKVHITAQKNKKKGSWDRYLWIADSRVIKEYELWLTEKPESEWLFPTSTGKRISASGHLTAGALNHRVKKAAEAAGITKLVRGHPTTPTSYWGRHSKFTDQRLEGIPDWVISEMGGTSPKMLDKHYTAATQAQIMDLALGGEKAPEPETAREKELAAQLAGKNAELEALRASMNEKMASIVRRLEDVETKKFYKFVAEKPEPKAAESGEGSDS